MKNVDIKISITIYALLAGFLMTATILVFAFVPHHYPANWSILIFQAIAVLLITAIFAFCDLNKRSGKFSFTLAPNQLAVICACIVVSYTISILLSQLITPLLMSVFLTAFLLAPLVKRRNVFLANLFTNIFIFITITIGQASQYLRIHYASAIMFLIGVLFGSVTAFILTYENRRFQFILKAIIICLLSVGIAVGIFAFTFTPPEGLHSMEFRSFTNYPRSMGELVSTAFISTFIAFFAQLILTILLQPILEKIFNILTNSRLIDLTDHNFPLMKRLIAETPGTFNHSLTVANFAEVCAMAIGENPYLARAAAYYHDIGKLENPQFFKENQQDDTNPHDSVLPEVSAEIIRSHAEYGLELCKQYRIPKEIYSVAIEHHGTMPITVFLAKAQSMTDGKIDVIKYSYKGPVPTTKIAAIIMICDTAEAAIRAAESAEYERRDEILSGLIQDRIGAGQFDACDITLKELATIKNTILSALSGMYHKRIKYPDGK